MNQDSLYPVFMPVTVYPCWAYALERAGNIKANFDIIRQMPEMSRKPDKMIKRKRLQEGDFVDGDLL